MHVFSLDVFISFVHSRSVSKFTGKTFHHRNGVKAVYNTNILFPINLTRTFSGRTINKEFNTMIMD